MVSQLEKTPLLDAHRSEGNRHKKIWAVKLSRRLKYALNMALLILAVSAVTSLLIVNMVG